MSVAIGGEPMDIGVYCGSKRPPMLMSSDSRMQVDFASHAPSQSKGFIAIYNFVTGNCYVNIFFLGKRFWATV